LPSSLVPLMAGQCFRGAGAGRKRARGQHEANQTLGHGGDLSATGKDGRPAEKSKSNHARWLNTEHGGRGGQSYEDGSVLHTNGSAIFHLDQNGARKRLCEDKLIEHVVGCD